MATLPNIVPDSKGSGQTIGTPTKPWASVYAEKLNGLKWESGVEYKADDIVAHDGAMYQCLTANTDVTFTPSNWQVIGGGSSSGGSLSVTQVTKLGVTASASSPKRVDISIDRTELFNRLPVEVLKFKAGSTGVVSTANDFSVSDASDFNDNAYVEFDDTMHLRAEYPLEVTDSLVAATDSAGNSVSMHLIRTAAVSLSDYQSVSEVVLS